MTTTAPGPGDEQGPGEADAAGLGAGLGAGLAASSTPLVPDGARPPLAVLDSAIEAVVEVESAIRRLTAIRTVLLDAARRQALLAEAELLRPASDTARGRLTDREAELAHRAFVADVATALQLPEPATSGLIEEARALVHDLPDTLGVLAAGTVSYRHAQVVIENTADLDDAARAAVESAVLPHAGTTTAAGLRRRIRRARERIHPEPARVRHLRAAEKRCVRLDPAADGMAWLSAFVSAAAGNAVMDRLDHAAAALGGPDEPRTRGQLRADTLTALLLDDPDGTASRALAATEAPRAGRDDDTDADDADAAGSADPSAVRDRARLTSLARTLAPRVFVTVPVLTLLGGDEPGDLDGYGPVDPDTARELAAAAPSFTRILTHPHTGAVLSVGRGSYAVPADLRRHLAVRDGTCRFPGCGRRAVACDVDHVRASTDGGVTHASNLMHLCRHHHRLKHETSWRVSWSSDDSASAAGSGGPNDPPPEVSPPGAVRWSSPTGRVHTTLPAEPGISPPF